MKRMSFSVVVLAVLFAASAWAEIPRTISYQGILTDNNNVVVPDGSYSITFRIYDVASGGTALWEQTQSVQVTNGRFNVILGGSPSLDALTFDDPYWLALQVAPDDEMETRIEMAASPYALNARSVEPGAAVTSINGLTDDVTLAAGTNVTITQSNDTLYIAASGSGGLTLPFAGTSSSNLDAFKVTQTGLGTQGRAGNFEIDDIANNNEAMRVVTNGQGDALSVRHIGSNGIGSAVVIEKTGATAVDPALVVKGDSIYQQAAAIHGRLRMKVKPIWGTNDAIIVNRGDNFHRTVSLGASPLGGHITLRDTLDTIFAELRGGEYGFGGILTLARSSTLRGVNLYGNFDGLGNAYFSLRGNSNSLSLDMGSATGDGTVNLPNDAVSATEMLDEPGVASETSNSTVTFTGSSTYDVVLSRSITVPSAGWVFVIGTCQLNANTHTSGTESNFELGVSDVSSALPANQDATFFLPATAPSGLYAQVATAHGLFEVTPGPHTFYLLARELSGSGSANDMQLSVIFFPTQYGDVTPTLVSAGAPSDESARTRGPLTPAEIAAEQAEAEAFHRDRLQREVDAMRIRLEEIERKLAERE